MKAKLKRLWASARATPKALALYFIAALGLTALPASANLGEIGTQLATQIGQFVVIISAMGMAGVSVVIMATAFKMAFNFVRGIK